MTVSAENVEQAAARLVGVVAPTPVERSPRLSERVAGEVLLKREDLQVVRSYKVRGAYNLVAQLDGDAHARGVVCASAGNHGQGVASAARAMGVACDVFVPQDAPIAKADAIDAQGATVHRLSLIHI